MKKSMYIIMYVLCLLFNNIYNTTCMYKSGLMTKLNNVLCTYFNYFYNIVLNNISAYSIQQSSILTKYFIIAKRYKKHKERINKRKIIIRKRKYYTFSYFSCIHLD